MSHVVTTNRLRLRPMQSGDVDLLYGLYADPAVAEWIFADGRPPDRGRVAQLVADNIERAEHRGSGLMVTELSETGEVVGRCG